MSTNTLLLLVFVVGILGGIALFGRRCQRHSAAKKRIVAAADAKEEVIVEPVPEPLTEDAEDAVGEAE